MLEPDNEEAIFMLINISLKKSDFKKVKDLKKNFSVICNKLCEKISSIDENLKSIEPKNES